jgi:hypothetical protein
MGESSRRPDGSEKASRLEIAEAIPWFHLGEALSKRMSAGIQTHIGVFPANFTREGSKMSRFPRADCSAGRDGFQANQQ